jgi:hypothetical protein
METPHEVLIIGDAKGIRQLAESPMGDAAFDPVTMIAQYTQKARVVALNVGAAVHRQAHQAAALQKAAQDGVDVRVAEREQGEVRIEQIQRGLGPRQHRAQLALEPGAGVETQDGGLAHIVSAS